MPADVATPLAVVLAELLQNAVEHAFLEFEADEADGSTAARVGPAPVGHIQVHLVNDLNSLTLEVIDDGSGLPEGFDIDAIQSLGLSIVRDLVRSQLDGTITMRNRSERRPRRAGTVVAIELPAGGQRVEPQRAGRRKRSRAEVGGGRARWVRSGSPAAGGQPGLAQLAPLLFRGAAPHARLLIGGQGEVEARLLASQLRQTRLAASIWSTAGPVVPMGKNRSGSVLRQAASCLQSLSSHSTVRFHIRATMFPPLPFPKYTRL